MSNKILSKAQYYVALGLYICAAHWFSMAKSAENDLAKLVGSKSRVLDAVYADPNPSPESFDAALAMDEIVVDMRQVETADITQKGK